MSHEIDEKVHLQFGDAGRKVFVTHVARVDEAIKGCTHADAERRFVVPPDRQRDGFESTAIVSLEGVDEKI